MEKYKHVENFKIKYCEVDFKDELKISTILSYLEEVACASADELGFGYAYIKPKGYAFMVSNICLECIDPFVLGQTATVSTWPTPPSFATFCREYQMHDENGALRLNATSRWCLVDMQTGKLLPSKAIDNQDYSTYNTDKVLHVESWKIPAFTPQEGEMKFCMTVANSEYDHNMHVNNTRYADYCMNCFTVEELAARKLKRFSISYVKQCFEGQVLRFYLKALGGGEYLAHGFNEKDETVVRSHIVFAEKGVSL